MRTAQLLERAPAAGGVGRLARLVEDAAELDAEHAPPRRQSSRRRRARPTCAIAMPSLPISAAPTRAAALVHDRPQTSDSKLIAMLSAGCRASARGWRPALALARAASRAAADRARRACGGSPSRAPRVALPLEQRRHRPRREGRVRLGGADALGRGPPPPSAARPPRRGSSSRPRPASDSAWSKARSSSFSARSRERVATARRSASASSESAGRRAPRAPRARGASTRAARARAAPASTSPLVEAGERERDAAGEARAASSTRPASASRARLLGPGRRRRRASRVRAPSCTPRSLASPHRASGGRISSGQERHRLRPPDPAQHHEPDARVPLLLIDATARRDKPGAGTAGSSVGRPARSSSATRRVGRAGSARGRAPRSAAPRRPCRSRPPRRAARPGSRAAPRPRGRACGRSSGASGRPVSRSSCATTSALIGAVALEERQRALGVARLEQPARARARARSKSAASRIAACLITSARPARAAARGGSVRSVARVDPDQARLVEGAHQVLAAAQVHAGLPADARVDHREQRGRHLHDRRCRAAASPRRSPRGRRPCRRRARRATRAAVGAARRGAPRRACATCARFLLRSPSGTSRRAHAEPRLRGASAARRAP